MESSIGSPAVPAPAALMLSPRLSEALADLLSRAPAQLFPKARRLYFDKYPLEGHPDLLASAQPAGPFRTFVLSESPERELSATVGELTPDSPEANPNSIPMATSMGVSGSPGEEAASVCTLALVHWQQPLIDLNACRRYLQEQWQLETVLLEPMEKSWFREGGAWVRVSPPGAGPAPAPVAPAANG
jgi:hypothetical protein